MEAVLGAAFARALGPDSTPNSSMAIEAIARDGKLARLSPFASDCTLMVLELEIGEDAGDAWKVMLAFPAETLETLFADSVEISSGPRATPNPADAPFGDLPLTLSAVLVEMPVGFTKLAALKPGDILPVSVARSVPLRIGDRTIAYGTIGELDDRVAVQVSRAFSTEGSHS